MTESLQARSALDISLASSEPKQRVIEAFRGILGALARSTRIAAAGAVLAFGSAAVNVSSVPEAGERIHFDVVREAIARVLSLYGAPANVPREEWVVKKAMDGRGRVGEEVVIQGERFWTAALQEETSGPTYYYLMRESGGAQYLGDDSEGGEEDALSLFDVAMKEARRATGGGFGETAIASAK